MNYLSIERFGGIPRNIILFLAILVALGIWLIAIPFFGILIPLIGLFGLCIFVWAIVFPRQAFVFLVVWNFLQNLPRYLPGPIQNADLLDELILVSLTVRWVLLILAGKQKFRRTPLDIPALLFLIFYLFSCVINQVPLMNALFAFRDVFQYILLFYALIQINYGSKLLVGGIQLFYLLAGANFIALFVQTTIFFLRTGTLFIEDEGVGLMGISGAHKLGYFAGLLLVNSIARAITGLRTKWYWFIILTLTIFITSARAVYYMIPISLLIVYGRQIFSNPRNLVRILLASVLFIGMVLIYINLPITRSATLDIRKIYTQQFGTQDAGTLRRVGFLEYSWETLTAHNIILGTGPGTYVSKTPTRLGSELFTKFRNDFPFKNSFNTGSQISLTIVEYGFLGTSLIILVYLTIFLTATRWARRYKTSLIKYLSSGTQLMVVMTAMSMASINIFELQEVIFVLWYIFGVFVVMSRVEKQKYMQKGITGK